MFRLLFLLLLTNTLFADQEQKEAIRSIFSEDSTFQIRLTSQYSGGTQHGAKLIEMIAYEEDLGDTSITTLTAKRFPLFPHFSKLYTIQKGETGATPAIYLALGWSSGGSGHESISGWIIRRDHRQIDIIDRFELFKPRSYPDILFNPATFSVAILRLKLSYEREIESLKEKELDRYSFVVMHANGSTTDLFGKKGEKKTKGIEEKFSDYLSRPYKSGKPEYDEIVILIKATPEGFAIIQ